MGPLFPLLAFPLARALKGGVKRLQHGSDNAALNLEQRGASALSSHVSQLVAEMRPCGRFELVNLVLAGKGSIPRRIDPSARSQDAMQLDGGELWCIIELAGVLLPRAIDGTMGASTAQPTAAASSSSSATPHAILPRASAYSLSLFPSHHVSSVLVPAPSASLCVVFAMEAKISVRRLKHLQDVAARPLRLALLLQQLFLALCLRHPRLRRLMPLTAGSVRASSPSSSRPFSFGRRPHPRKPSPQPPASRIRIPSLPRAPRPPLRRRRRPFKPAFPRPRRSTSPIWHPWPASPAPEPRGSSRSARPRPSSRSPGSAPNPS